MNSGQPPSPQKIQVNPSAENSGQLLEWIQANPLPPKRFRWTLQLKIKANSSAENWGQLLEWIPVNPPPERFRWTLQLNFKANSSAEN